MKASPLRIALVVPYYDPRESGDAAVHLARFPTVPELAVELKRRGHDVTAFHLSRRRACAQWGGVVHRFVPTGPLRRAVSRLVWRAAPRFRAPYYEAAFELIARAMRGRPDVLHVFGINLDLNVCLLAVVAALTRTPLVLHFHGGGPAADALTRALQRFSLRQAAAVLFTDPSQAAPWCEGVALAAHKVRRVCETSTRFCPVPRPAPAERTLSGVPACLMLGRLHPVKDPVLALAAFARVVEALPETRLHLVFQLDDFAGRLQALVQAVPCLANRVVFHGYTKPADLPALLAATDLLVQCSRREWSGLSVLEALATGVPTILTDIPAFRALTDDGRVARLVRVGDAPALARAIVDLGRDAAERRRLGAAGRVWFEARLSFPALARDVEAVYRTVVGPAVGPAGPDAGPVRLPSPPAG